MGLTADKWETVKAALLLESENFFMARRAYRYLEKQTLNEQMKQRVKAFQEKNEKEGRILH